MEARHDIQALEKKVHSLSETLKQLAQTADTESLLRHIRQPGWTTPAEFLLVTSVVETLTGTLTVAAALQKQLVQASGMIGRK
jgi:hypothetical protein